MHSANPIILLVEDSTGPAFLIERAVLKEFPQCRLVWARNIQEARARAVDLDIELFLCDINLPDGSGLDFLWEMSSSHPLARAIVITAEPLPEHYANTAALGVLHYVEKPLKLPLFLEYLRQALTTERISVASSESSEPPPAAAACDGNTSFRATLANLSVVDILQLKCLTGASTVIEFRSGHHVGRTRVQNGEIVDAEAGSLRGAEAVHEIISWKNGEVSEHRRPEWRERTIEVPWHALLMDAAHRLDEQNAVA